MSDEPTSADPNPMPDSWKADDAEALRESKKGRGWLIAGIIVGVLVLGGLAAVFITNANQPERAWPDSVGGRPPTLGSEGDTTAKVASTEAKPGVYIWSSFDGWHLWAVTGDGLPSVKGTITSNTDIKRAEASSPGDGTVTKDGKTVTFDLNGTNPALGVDFEPGFAKKLTFTVEGPDGPIDASLITLGQDHPATGNPVVVNKAVVEKS